MKQDYLKAWTIFERESLQLLPELKSMVKRNPTDLEG
jgi:hypothetical protein